MRGAFFLCPGRVLVPLPRRNTCLFVRSLRARWENIEADALQNQVFFYTIKGALKKALVK